MSIFSIFWKKFFTYFSLGSPDSFTNFFQKSRFCKGNRWNQYFQNPSMSAECPRVAKNRIPLQISPEKISGENQKEFAKKTIFWPFLERILQALVKPRKDSFLEFTSHVLFLGFTRFGAFFSNFTRKNFQKIAILYCFHQKKNFQKWGQKMAVFWPFFEKWFSPIFL